MQNWVRPALNPNLGAKGNLPLHIEALKAWMADRTFVQWKHGHLFMEAATICCLAEFDHASLSRNEGQWVKATVLLSTDVQD